METPGIVKENEKGEDFSPPFKSQFCFQVGWPIWP